MKSLFIALCLALLAVVPACSSSVEAEQGGLITLCGDCGQIAGTDECCDENATACEGCGLTKDAPGCCKIEKGSGKIALCADCGMAKGGEGCCDEAATTCDSCGMIKGAPGCCLEG